jgi:hypothetical protein
MKSKPQLDRALQAWLQVHYYDEDYELAAAFAAFQADLSEEEHAALRALLADRLAADPTLVDVLLAGRAGATEAAPVLTGLLEQQSDAGMMARALIDTLAVLEHTPAYDAVLRFLESDLEMEAFLCLAQLDFTRCLSVILRGEQRPYIRKAHLQALGRHRKHQGLDALRDALRTAAPAWPRASEALEAVLTGSAADHNPFSPGEVELLLYAVASDST